MKMFEIYKECIKAYEDYKRHKAPRAVIMGEHDNFYFATTNGYNGYFIPKQEFLLNVDMITLGNGATFNLDSFIKNANIATPATSTNEIRMGGKNNKITYQKIKNDNHEEWVEINLLKNFENSEFRMTDAKFSPIYVYEYDVLCGIVMPCRLKD